MKSLNILIVSLICISSVYCQCKIDNAQPVTLDNGVAVVCLHVNVNNTYTNQTYAFRVNVDYFEALVINGFADYIKNQTKNGATSVSIDLQYQNTQNTQIQTIQIYNKTELRYRDILSFIIITNEGNFDQIRTDNEKCDNIGGTVCSNGEAFSSIGADGIYPGSDPRLFVSWMGTDVDKNHFISHTRRLSRFSSFSVGSIYNDAKTIINA